MSVLNTTSYQDDPTETPTDAPVTDAPATDEKPEQV